MCSHCNQNCANGKLFTSILDLITNLNDEIKWVFVATFQIRMRTNLPVFPIKEISVRRRYAKIAIIDLLLTVMTCKLIVGFDI